ncbi:superinfection immunity protein [Bacillus sp. S3]|uniref:superinfection immunity protein n=1 Tax=Bacillus sp. S3 TaxID=486398 RepID=UPI001CC1D561|nr:superinfection immunity protein [Bacillus sp. S3]
MDGSSSLGIIFLIVLIGYFLPFLVAMLRKKSNVLAIFFLNLLTGWTGIGWLAAFIWALTKDHKVIVH